MMKNVLYISINGFMGGAERVVFNLCRGHLDNKNFYPILVTFEEGPLVEEAKACGIETHVIQKKYQVSKPVSLIHANLEIYKLIIKTQPEIIHFTMSYPAVTLFSGVLKSRAKKVLFQHGPVGSFWDRASGLLPMNAIFYNSHFLKESHQRDLKNTPKFGEHVIPLAVTPNTNEKYSNLDLEKWMIENQDSIKILLLGRISKAKGQIQFLNALNLIRKNHGDEFLNKFQFLIVGSAGTKKDSSTYEKFLNLRRSHSLENRVHHFHHEKNVGKLFHDCDLTVVPTIVPESFGLVAAEAMLSGCLVLGSSGGGLDEILKDNETGYVFSGVTENFENNLSQALTHLLQQMDDMKSNEFESIRNQAKKYISSHHSMENMMKSVEMVYFDLIKV